MKLKPCPFCGRVPRSVRKFTSQHGQDWYTVECKAPWSRCHMKPRTPLFSNENEAIEAWNRRANELDQR